MSHHTTPENVAASVRQRLLNISRTQRLDFQYLLTRYAQERFLYRLSISEHRESLILKGATLFWAWTGQPHRATRDLDFLGYGPADPSHIESVVQALCRLPADNDGLLYLAQSVRSSRIRAGADYPGWHVRLEARLRQIRISLRIDIGFGEVVSPAIQETTFPTLLKLPPPVLRTYPMETVVAEKLHALVDLGLANSRLKDYFDLHYLMRHFEFSGNKLTTAVRATFHRRITCLPVRTPVGLSDAFSDRPGMERQWQKFLARTGASGPRSPLSEVTKELNAFLLPLLEAAHGDQSWDAHWPATGPWRLP